MEGTILKPELGTVWRVGTIYEFLDCRAKGLCSRGDGIWGVNGMEFDRGGRGSAIVRVWGFAKTFRQKFQQDKDGNACQGTQERDENGGRGGGFVLTGRGVMVTKDTRSDSDQGIMGSVKGRQFGIMGFERIRNGIRRHVKGGVANIRKGMFRQDFSGFEYGVDGAASTRGEKDQKDCCPDEC